MDWLLVLVWLVCGACFCGKSKNPRPYFQMVWGFIVPLILQQMLEQTPRHGHGGVCSLLAYLLQKQ